MKKLSLAALITVLLVSAPALSAETSNNKTNYAKSYEGNTASFEVGKRPGQPRSPQFQGEVKLEVGTRPRPPRPPVWVAGRRHANHELSARPQSSDVILPEVGTRPRPPRPPYFSDEPHSILAEEV